MFLEGDIELTAKVLIVDDVADNVKLLAYCLGDEGYDVLEASNGPDALRQARQNRPDAVLLDVMMPEMDGYEVLRRLKEDTQLRSIPVLLVTALSDDSDVVKGLTAGADDYITKPFDRAVVVARTRSAVNRHQSYLDKRRLLAELQKQASTDGLTGLMNRRAFLEQFERELTSAQRHATPLACAIVDLDFFKRVNDEHGHAVGDVALKMLSALIKQHCRAGDLVCRYGGEEFCILLPHTTEADALSWAERLRESVAELRVPTGEHHVRLTISVGVTEGWQEADTPSQMAERADQALLLAKRSGRNRTLCFSRLNQSDSSASSGADHGGASLQSTAASGIMTSPVLTVCCVASMNEVAELLLQSRLSSLPVTDEQGALVGTISEKDVLLACVRGELDEPVSRRMATNVVRFDTDASAQSVFDFFCRSTIRRVFVTRDRQPVGIISRGMLLRYMINSERLGRPSAGVKKHLGPSVASGRRRGLLAETADTLGRELAVLRDRIAPHAADDDACIVDIVSRIEELMSDLLSPRDLDVFSADRWSGRQQPWSV
jgi:diguanylate cyclase (GGDEF)-like protein